MTETPGPPPPPRRRILAVMEASDLGLCTAALGVAVAARMGCDLVFQVAVPVDHIEARSAGALTQTLAEHREAAHEQALPWFEVAADLAKAAHLDSRAVLTFDEDPFTAVLRVADEQDCELIVVGSRGRGTVARVLQGSLVADLVRLSPRPVLVCRDDMRAGLAAPRPGSAAPGAGTDA